MAPDVDPDEFREDLKHGLRQRPRRVPSKYLYDARGSELFDDICHTDDYYPTTRELQIMEAHVDEMADCVGPRARIVEYGSGTGRKTKLLLKTLEKPTRYVPIDISQAALDFCEEIVEEEVPDLDIEPLLADYTREITLPDPPEGTERTVGYFPGSTVGNFEPDEAAEFLGRIADTCGADGGLLLGVDLVKSRDVLERAYNDSEGVTAEFNINYLRHANRVADTGFDIEGFEHRAVFNEEASRVEMRLVSLRPQAVAVGDERFEFDEGDFIVTEHSYKYTRDRFESVADEAGFEPEKVWTDSDDYFSIWYLDSDG